MAGLTLQGIRTALADQIRTAVNASGRETNVYGTRPSAEPQYPYIIIDPAADYLDYWQSFGAAGVSTVRFELEVNPAGSDALSAGVALDDYLSAGTGNTASIVDAIMATPTLGLAGCSCVPHTVTVDKDMVTAIIAVEVNISKIGARA
jgi:hypothetical protein